MGAFPGGSDGKESACDAGDLWVRKILWRRAWQPTPVFLPGESHRQRTLGGLQSTGVTKELTEQLNHILSCGRATLHLSILFAEGLLNGFHLSVSVCCVYGYTNVTVPAVHSLGVLTKD